MGESEPLDANVKKAEIALKEEKVVVEEEKGRARKRTAEDQGFLDTHRAQRAELVARLPKATVSLYERIRQKLGGVTIAEVVNSRCQACQITIRPQYLQDLRKGTELMRCEQCGRFLYINPPVSFEDVAARVG
jgi:predicted  nucleic acid-binding Zn-ribbon protein